MSNRAHEERMSISKIPAVALLLAVLIVSATHAAERPPVMGRNGAVSAGHPLTTAAAFEILTKGGNAFDAGVAALLAGGVVEQDLYSLGGEGLVLVYPRSEGKVTSIVGQGWAPKGATIEWYKSRGKTLDGEGLDPAVVPGTIHAALTVLEKWGTMSFEQVSARAIDYASNGFPLRPRTATAIEGNLKFFQNWPENQHYWLKPDGSMYKPGETVKLPTLAHTLTLMVGRTCCRSKGPNCRHRRCSRSLLQRRHRRRDGPISQTAPGTFRTRRLRGVFREDRRAGDDQLSWVSGL
ncbi:MAG: hypothetical protein DMG14_32365 [Acidobacteria bacterium]|nr:MAG: hypothetical protein DMG14_32365 [Acidobacteriota bacterium]